MSNNNLPLKNLSLNTRVSQAMLTTKAIFRRKWKWWRNSLIASLSCQTSRKIKKQKIEEELENKITTGIEDPGETLKIHQEDRAEEKSPILWKINNMFIKSKKKKLLAIYHRIILHWLRCKLNKLTSLKNWDLEEER